MDIAVYRARIGLFNAAVRIKSKPLHIRGIHFKTRPMTVSFIFTVAIVLFLSGDIELNPGPPKLTPSRKYGTDNPGSMPNQNMTASAEAMYTDTHFDFQMPTPVHHQAHAEPSNAMLLNAINAIGAKVTSMEEKFESWCMQIDDSVTKLKTSHDQLKQENEKLRDTAYSLQERVNELESSSKANNIIISGIPSTPTGSMIDSVRKFLTDKLNIPNAKDLLISDAFKLRDNRVLVKLGLIQDKNKILSAAKQSESTEFRIKPDICKAWHEARKKLVPVYEKAVAENRSVKVTKDFIIVDGVKKYVYDFESGMINSQIIPKRDSGNKENK